MKEYPFLAIVGAIGAFIANLFGGWNTSMTTLLIFMAIDLVTGFMVAAIFKNSPKTATGLVKSVTTWKGLCKKGVSLLFVLVGHRLDLSFGTNFIRDAVTIAFIANELISIVENAGLMGVPIPKTITDAIEVLKEKSDKEV